jgi:hypothetical protein
LNPRSLVALLQLSFGLARRNSYVGELKTIYRPELPGHIRRFGAY